MEETLVILDHVNKFYTQSFNQLIILTVAILAFSALVLAILIGFYQRWFLKIEHNAIETSLKKELGEHFNKKLSEVEFKYQEKELHLQAEITLLEEKVQKNIDEIAAGVFHVQGVNQLENDNYLGALRSFARASIKNMKCANEANLKTMFGFINTCLQSLDHETLGLDLDLRKLVDKLIEDLEEYNENSRYTREINDLKIEFKNTLAR